MEPKRSLGDLGRLREELFRAVRLVVDTGMHARRWTREQAIDCMLRTTGMGEKDTVAEIERYAVFPAQACAYKIGMKIVMEVREKANAELGNGFDIRRFMMRCCSTAACRSTLSRHTWTAGSGKRSSKRQPWSAAACCRLTACRH